MKCSLFVFAGLCCCLCGCRGGEPELPDMTGEGSSQLERVRIALRSEPDGLNPILTTQANSRYVFDQIFQTLNGAHPITSEPVPVLASLPVREQLGGGRERYRYRLDSAARWPDGSPVGVADVIFSMKVLLHPLIEAGPYRTYFGMVEDVVVDTADNLVFSFITREPYMLAAKVIGDLYVYPEYVYDSERVLRQIPLTTFTNSSAILERLDRDEVLRNYAGLFTDPDRSYLPGRVVGSGPYQLVEWEDSQRITLNRRPDYWAVGRNEDWLRAESNKLIFSIIPDQTTLVNALRDEAVDVALDLPIDKYRQLSREDYLTDRYAFSAVPSYRYYAILLNQRDPLLRDSSVRRALAHLVNTDQLINRLLPGLARPIAGPVLPDKSYYNRELPTIPYDPERASQLLSAAGWSDTDGDGVLDKVVDGVRQDFRLPLLSYPTSMSTAIGLLVAEEARKVGVEIEVVRREPRALLESLNSGDYSSSVYGQGFDPTPDDFAQVWDSRAVPPMGTNRAGFDNREADSLIARIGRTMDAERRMPLYYRFQEIVYANQPMIFLFSPYDRVVVSRRLKYQLTSSAPNVLFNAITLR